MKFYFITLIQSFNYVIIINLLIFKFLNISTICFYTCIFRHVTYFVLQYSFSFFSFTVINLAKKHTLEISHNFVLKYQKRRPQKKR
jgi:hypothetical protein